MAQATVLKFSGHQHLRHRLVLSILSGKPVRIDHIRSEDKNPGLRDYEVSLLRLIDKLTNGTIVEISVTGTSILLKPGVVVGGSVTHDCPLSRSVGYYLDPIIMFAPFAKNPLHLTLRGVTTDDKDLSVDLMRTVTLPTLQPFGLSEGLELRIKKRGAPPKGGGEVQFLCPVIKQVKTINFVDPGKVKRIRGVAHAVRVSPQFSNRLIEASRSVLNRYIPDIYVYSDVYKGEDSGKSPGYALSLLAESTTSAFHCAEAVSEPGATPEDVALLASRALLAEIKTGGEDVSRCRLGEPTARTIQFLRDVREFFGTHFKIVPADGADPTCNELIFSCFGVGFVNVNRSLA